MKLLLSFIFFLLSFGCLFAVCNAEKWDQGNVLFWACVFALSVYNIDRQFKKNESKENSK